MNSIPDPSANDPSIDGEASSHSGWHAEPYDSPDIVGDAGALSDAGAVVDYSQQADRLHEMTQDSGADVPGLERGMVAMELEIPDDMRMELDAMLGDPAEHQLVPIGAEADF